MLAHCWHSGYRVAMETETETAQQPYVHPTSRWLTWCDECKCHTEDSDHSHTPQCIACGTER